MSNGSDDRPQNIDEYKTWLAKEHKVKVSKIEAYYNTVVAKIQRDVATSAFWQELKAEVPDFGAQYEIETGYNLLAQTGFALVTKPFDSFLLKTFRKNILDNNSWPEAPTNGWWLPDNWYVRTSDLVRTLMVVKYLDGVSFLSDKIRVLADTSGHQCDVERQAREEGYYAYHLNVKHEVEIPRENWDTYRITVSVEIQLTTQLQEVIRKLTHHYYEGRRQHASTGELKWQWDYTSEEFTANYLGHILHYVEGMIMDVRNKQKKVAP